MDAATHDHDLSSLHSGRGPQYDLPIALNDEDGGGECYPNDENEVGG